MIPSPLRPMHSSLSDRLSFCGAGQAWTILAVGFLCFADSAIRWPVPAANEPHYLTMARHHWDPAWCRRDLFLESTPAHTVFYQTLGIATRLLTLEQTAWLGRILAFSLFSLGWVRLCRRLALDGPAPIGAILVYLILASSGNFSGEWIIRGCEAKVFSYGLVLLAISFTMDRRWIPAAALWGAAISFHTLVGIWALLAMTLAEILCRWNFPRRRVPLTDPRASIELAEIPAHAADRRLPWLFATLVITVTALPGLLSALTLLWSGDAQQQYQATYIHVFYRLAHHLDPMAFSITNYCYAGGLIAVWLCGRRWIDSTPARQLFSRFIGISIVLALVGIAIGWGPRPAGDMPGFAWRMALLKFYPFRLFDGMMPIASAIAIVQIAQTVSRRLSATFTIVGTIVCFALWGFSLADARRDEHPSRMSKQHLAEWQDICDWIDRQTPAEALFITPNHNWGFRWYAERAEFVSLKDCPQDAPHLVEWNRRLKLIARWSEQSFPDGYSEDELLRFQQMSGADYLLAQRLGPIDLVPIYRNSMYRLYRLPRPQAAESAPAIIQNPHPIPLPQAGEGE
ncbi:MAG: DUF6798 domain-containing protein [Planctomycetaceae bacterium]